jgi:vacuolar-type H+-ATPase subunit E/Vma4
VNGTLGSVDELVAHVQRRAEQRAVALETAAEQRAREIEEEGAERAKRLRDEILEQGRRAAAEARRQRLSAAELERRHRRLAAREARLDRVWESARDALAKRGADGVPAETLARLARDAARRLGGEEVVVQLDAASRAHLGPDDVAGWRQEGDPALRLDAEPLHRGHGLVARAGRSSIDATFEGRLLRARDLLRSDIDALLAGDARGPSS